MKNYYVIFFDRRTPGGARIEGFPDVGIKNYELEDGLSVKNRFSGHITLEMSVRYPDNRMLYSMVNNSSRLPILSKRLKEIIEKRCDNVEFLPVTILNHRNKIASADYYILIVLTLADCIDDKKSDYIRCSLMPSEYSSWKKIVFEKSKIPNNLNVFKLKKIPTANVITQTLKDAIEADSEIKGVKFIPIDEFKKISYG